MSKIPHLFRSCYGTFGKNYICKKVQSESITPVETDKLKMDLTIEMKLIILIYYSEVLYKMIEMGNRETHTFHFLTTTRPERYFGIFPLLP